MNLLYSLIGIFIAIIKIIAEYPFWSKVKNEKEFHAVGFFAVLVILLFLAMLCQFQIIPLALFILCYWNAFEIIGNLAHRQHPFYIGENARFDKGLRSLIKTPEIGGIKTIYVLKFALHLFTWILIYILYEL